MARTNDTLTLTQLAAMLANARFAEVKVVRTKDLPAGKAVLVDAVIMVGEGTDLANVIFNASLSPDDRELLRELKVKI